MTLEDKLTLAYDMRENLEAELLKDVPFTVFNRLILAIARLNDMIELLSSQLFS